MPTLSIVFGAALTALGLAAYLNPEPFGVGKNNEPPKPHQGSSLSPAGVGGVLLVAGLVSLARPGARKHAMHAAAAVSLLGAVGGLVPVVLRNFAVEQVAVKVGLGMSVLSAIFLALCVNSFIQVRKARRAAAPPAA